MLDALAGLGYRDIPADVDLEDWDPAKTGEGLASDAIRLTRERGDAAVVLFHGWPPQTLDALPSTIDGLRAAGATFVGIDELERFTA